MFWRGMKRMIYGIMVALGCVIVACVLVVIAAVDEIADWRKKDDDREARLANLMQRELDEMSADDRRPADLVKEMREGEKHEA